MALLIGGVYLPHSLAKQRTLAARERSKEKAEVTKMRPKMPDCAPSRPARPSRSPLCALPAVQDAFMPPGAFAYNARAAGDVQTQGGEANRMNT